MLVPAYVIKAFDWSKLYCKLSLLVTKYYFPIQATVHLIVEECLELV